MDEHRTEITTNKKRPAVVQGSKRSGVGCLRLVCAAQNFYGVTCKPGSLHGALWLSIVKLYLQ
jgi:hypothetical protein